MEKTFDLVQNGVVLLKDMEPYGIIQYLEKLRSKSISETLLSFGKKFFEKFPDVDKYNVGYYGTYFKYELAGETCDFCTEGINEDFTDEMLEFIAAELEVWIETDDAVKIWGKVIGRGQKMVYLENRNGTVVLETKRYDCE